MGSLGGKCVVWGSIWLVWVILGWFLCLTVWGGTGLVFVVSGWLEVIYIYKWRFGWYKTMFVVVSGCFLVEIWYLGL